MKYLIRRYAYLITKVCKNNNHSNYLCRKLHAFFMSLVESYTLILFYKQHMIKKTSWTILDFIQSLFIFVA